MAILLFENIHLVMEAESLLKQAGVPYELIPTPTRYSTDCGMSIQIDDEQLPPGEQALQSVSHRAVDLDPPGPGS